MEGGIVLNVYIALMLWMSFNKLFIIVIKTGITEITTPANDTFYRIITNSDDLPMINDETCMYL